MSSPLAHPHTISWLQLLVFMVAGLAEASPMGQLLFGNRALDNDKNKLHAWMLGGDDQSEPRPRRAAVTALRMSVLVLDPLVGVSSMLLMIWLLFYLFARPDALLLPSITTLQGAESQGTLAWIQQAGLRLVAVVVTATVVITPGVNGSARWFRGSLIPRLAACGCMAGLLALAFAAGGPVLPWAWFAAVSLAALAACNFATAAWVFWVFLHSIGVLA
jgi:hypothetical protein